jgi:inhibitor of cysteine peptidase
MPTLTLTRNDHGKVLTAAAGSVVLLTLPENPTTGYRWQLDASFGLRGRGSGFKTDSGEVGSGGARVFRFDLEPVEEVTLRATCRRTWMADEPASDHFEVTLKVVS